MLNSYLTITFRNFLKYRFFSFVNLAGLVTGLAACTFLIQYVSFELSFDDFHAKGDRIYRLTNDRYQDGKLIHHGVTTYPAVGPALAKDYPEIERHTRMMLGFNEINVRSEDKIHTGGTYFFADENFLSVFTFKLITGDPRTALSEPYAVVLSEDQARKYFGQSTRDLSKVIGKHLYFNLSKQPYVVTGICENIPRNSHLHFDALVSYATLVKMFPIADNSWTWSDMRHYFVLTPDVDAESLETKMPGFSERYFKGTQVTGSLEKFSLQPLTDIHLYSDYEYDIAITSNGKVVWGMLTVAFFILGLAWINYVNLTIAYSIKRAKEVSLRKVMGAWRIQIVTQFLIESLAWVGVSLALATAIVVVLQPEFNQLLHVELSLFEMASDYSTETIMILGGALLLSVLLASAYPAFVLSSWQPLSVLKGKFSYSSKNLVRKGLVVFQFTACTSLLISTIIISAQLKYLNKVDLGFDVHNTIVINAPMRTAWDSTFLGRVENFSHEMLQVKGVLGITASNKLPGDRLPRIFKVHVKDHPSEDYHTMSTIGVGERFFDDYKIKLIAGRQFTHQDFKSRWIEITSLIINQRAAKSLGFMNPETALGQEVFLENRFFTIVGVVGDYHQESLKAAIEPMLFRPVFGNSQSISLKVEEFNPGMIQSASLLFAKFFPDNGFDYYSLEEKYKTKYADDENLDKVIRIFSFVAIIISCLGLLGLSTHTIAQRTKEIGIRKVLGASVSGILYLLASDFITLVLVALAVTFPLAYLLMQDWLSGYIYHIAMKPEYFILPSLGILAIAIITISFQVIRTAGIKPSETIRYE